MLFVFKWLYISAPLVVILKQDAVSVEYFVKRCKYDNIYHKAIL